MPWWAVCFTIVATETSTLSFIGVPAAAYTATGNMTFLQLAMGYVVGRVLISLVLLPAYSRGDLVTSYELLGRRFGAPVQTVGRGDLSRHTHARRRRAPVRDGARDRGRHRRAGRLDDCRCWASR